MHVTSGLRASRTWHVWLQRVHGPDALGLAGAHLGDEVGVGDLGAGHLDGVAARRIVVPAERPLGLADVDDRALQHDGHVDGSSLTAAARSALKPAGWWKSGRVCSIGEDRATRTTTRWSTPTSTSSAASAGAISGVMPAHGASSSQDRRSPTTASGPIARRTAPITDLAKQRAVGAPLVAAVVGQAGEELADEAVLAGVDLHAVAAGRDGASGPPRRTRRRRRRCPRAPSTWAPRARRPRARATAPTAAPGCRPTSPGRRRGRARRGRARRAAGRRRRSPPSRARRAWPAGARS